MITTLPVGYVTAFIFIFFDVFLIAVIDYVIGYFCCTLYYKELMNGKPLPVKSAEVPGLTSYLLGKKRSAVNISAALVKLALLLAIFFINFRIKGRIDITKDDAIRQAVFEFDPSDDEWHRGTYHVVERPYGFFRESCKIVENNTVTYYQTAVNISDNLVVRNETRKKYSLIPINQSSLLCLSPKVIENAKPVLKVTGCSSLGTDQCLNDTQLVRNARLQINMSSWSGFKVDYEFGGEVGYGFGRFDDEDVRRSFPEYTAPKLFYVQQCIGRGKECCAQGNSSRCPRKPAVDALLTSRNGTHTLFERWRVAAGFGSPEMTLKRYYPGPVMEGDIEIGENRAAVALIDVGKSSGWTAFADVILIDSLVYRYRESTYKKKRPVKTTEIPDYIIGLGVVIVATVCILWGVAAVLANKDRRPRINTVDGLSSVMREELWPTGESLTRGKVTVIERQDDDVLQYSY